MDEGGLYTDSEVGSLTTPTNKGGVRGRIIYESGRRKVLGVEKVKVKLKDSQTPKTIKEIITTSQGRYEFPEIIEGNYLLEVSGADIRRKEVEITIVRRKLKNLDFFVFLSLLTGV